MNAEELYTQLEKDFITSEMSDSWEDNMQDLAEFLSDNYKKRSMGLVCDNSRQISKVYTAVFPSKQVMLSILDRDESNIMLFVHHPVDWDMGKAPHVEQQMDRDLLLQFRERGISIYNLHVPLDNYGEYSTSVSLARALGVEIQKPFGYYFGALCGVFGKTIYSTIQELGEKFKSVLGHRTSLYQYGNDEIKDRMVAITAGGGNMVSVLEEIAVEGVNTFITGISIRNEVSELSHKYAEDNRINILGGTHYSTEKPACLAICRYFERLGLPAEFIEGVPSLEDL
ncbi:Nif3-like dinuclear metal center hexameric protein [Chloroflexota bacterium]